jgi:N-acetyl-alpha-D-muramate 1-phosphate uridylyltransferase
MIKHGMVLAAGIGKRLQPLTLKMPKPLIEINNLTLIERAINLLIDFGVEEISVNVHYLAGQIEKFINEKKFNAKIIISKEIDFLLDTGGGVLEGTKYFNENSFLVINPDTLWSKKYLQELKILEEIYLKNNKPSLLLVDKIMSIDSSLTGDFNLENYKISKGNKNQFIFTGAHITSRKFLISENSNIFSMNKIWDNLIKVNSLFGLESKQKFFHLNTFEMYNKISKLKIID